MPAAIPLAIAGATMVASNMQNKAALKNNENQQNAAVNNAKKSADAAFGREQQYLQANPEPFAHFDIARPPQATISGVSPQAIMSGAFSRGTPAAPWSNFNSALHQGPQPGSSGFGATAFGALNGILGALGNPQQMRPPVGSGTGQVMPNGQPGTQLQPYSGMSPQALISHILGQQQQPGGMVNTQPQVMR